MFERTPGPLPSNIERNPREQVNAITLRYGRELEMVKKKKEKEKKVENSTKAKNKSREVDEFKSPKKAPEVKVALTVKAYKPRIPFLSRLIKHNIDKRFSKFLEVFKKLHINIPCANALAQMPSYAKFMKEILQNKRKLEDGEIINLNEKCSAILLNKLPPKLIDPRSFGIPCQIGSLSFDKGLCDLGASFNLMPLSVLHRVGLKEPTPINICLQLADRSITHPRGIIEDVLVKVDKFIFPINLIVFDMEEDFDIYLLY